MVGIKGSAKRDVMSGTTPRPCIGFMWRSKVALK